MFAEICFNLMPHFPIKCVSSHKDVWFSNISIKATPIRKTATVIVCIDILFLTQIFPFYSELKLYSMEATFI